MLRSVVSVCMQLFSDHMLGIELQHLGRLMVGPDHGVKQCHVIGFLVEFEKTITRQGCKDRVRLNHARIQKETKCGARFRLSTLE